MPDPSAFTDLSALPPAAPPPPQGAGGESHPGWEPEHTSVLVHLLADRWRQLEVERGPKEHSLVGSLWRHSDAGACSRKLSMAKAGFPREPMDLPGYWSTGVGTLIHDQLQAEAVRRFGDRVVIEEVAVVEGFDGSGHIDLILRIDCTGCDGAGSFTLDDPDDPWPCPDCSAKGWARIVYELKTVGGYAYKLKVGDRRAPAGPDEAHVRQVSLNALAAEADGPVDRVMIGYLAKDNISVGGARRRQLSELHRMGAEWLIPEDVWRARAAKEIARLNGIEDLLADEAPTLAARKIPPGELPVAAEWPPQAVIVDPMTSRWEVHGEGDDGEATILDSGKIWGGAMCRDYCGFRDACAATGEPGRLDLREAWKRVIEGGIDLGLVRDRANPSNLERDLYRLRDEIIADYYPGHRQQTLGVGP